MGLHAALLDPVHKNNNKNESQIRVDSTVGGISIRLGVEQV